MRRLCRLLRHHGHRHLVWRKSGASLLSGGYLVTCDRCGILRDLWKVTTEGESWSS